MKKILIITTALDLGGITTFVINLVNNLASKYDVTLAFTKDTASKLPLLSTNVKTVNFVRPTRIKIFLNMLMHGWLSHILKIKLRNNKKISPIKSIQRLAFAEAEKTVLPNHLTEMYDIAISSSEFYCNDLVALKINSVKKIAWIHPDYNSLNTDVRFDRKVLDKFDKIAVVSKSNVESLVSKIPEYKNKVVYVPNTLNVNFICENAKFKPLEYENIINEHIIITVCRLDNSSKRLDRAVKMCRALRDRGDRFKWFIVGDGPDKEFLSNLIKKFDLEDYMYMIGKRANPYPYMSFADLFVLTSQYEGRPIVIDEALTLACPVIVTKYASAEEQIHDFEGIIIENSDSNCVNDFVEKLNWNFVSQLKNNLKINNHYDDIGAAFVKGIEHSLGDK